MVLVSLLLTLAASCGQQAPSPIANLETLVTGSSDIVRGKVVKSTVEARYSQPGSESATPGDEGFLRLTFAVEGVLKGGVRGGATLTISVPATYIPYWDRRLPSETVADWLRENRPLLVFLRSNRKLGRGVYEVAPGSFGSGLYDGGFLELVPDAELQALAVDLVPLNRPELLLARTTALVKVPAHASGPPVYVQGIPIPSGFRLRGDPGHGSVAMWAPRSPALQREAIRWTEAKDARDRIRGVRTLASFPSKESAAVVRSLLADSSSYATPSDRVIYPVREAAQAVLNGWRRGSLR